MNLCIAEDNESGLAAAVYGFLYISSANSAVVVSLSFWTYIVFTDNAGEIIWSSCSVTKNSQFLYIGSVRLENLWNNQVSDEKCR